MPLKILGWGTMVGVAWLAIATIPTWMRPIQARAAQMVRFARSLQAPPLPLASPATRASLPSMPFCRAAQNAEYDQRDAAFKRQSELRQTSGAPF